MTLINSVKGLWLMLQSTKIFDPKAVFSGKRVVVIGAADSAFIEEHAAYINGFDYIVRVNKAIHSLTPEKMKFVGDRTDILFHSFYENTESGGGPIDFDLFSRAGVEYLINPHNNYKGLRAHLNYFKRNLKTNKTYILPRGFYKKMTKDFGNWVPTVGYSALYAVMNSGCKEVYITGFTFFKTPYADNYRDHVKALDENNRFIQKQGLHNPDLELKEFIKQLELKKKYERKIIMDPSLTTIVNDQKRYKNKN